MNAKTQTVETVIQRIARLQIATPKEKRIESLTLAHGAQVTDELFTEIATANLVKRESETIVLPAHRYENLSRGRGWARQGNGDKAVWGVRVNGGYEVGPGRWNVGATDGFRRKDSVVWTVKHVTVEGQTWTIAN